VREGRRGLRPLSSAAGFVRGERLAFNMPGFSPLEPAFASIVPAEGEECHGAVFELTPADWTRLCLSEGVPMGYRVRQVAVELYSGNTVQAYTLSPALLRAPMDLPPSARYLGLLRKGAREMGLTGAWQDKLAAIEPAPFGSREGSSRDSPLREYERGPGGGGTVYV
jgi:hypothetical protein